MDDAFWTNLNETGKQTGRFQDLIIGPLTQADIAKMASIVLSCKEEQLDSQFVRDIFDHTRGTPDFAFQALENCKRKGLHELANKKIGWSKDAAKVRVLSRNFCQKFHYSTLNIIFSMISWSYRFQVTTNYYFKELMIWTTSRGVYYI